MAPRPTSTSAEAPVLDGVAPLLRPGLRVSMELPEGGTCVAVVSAASGKRVTLSLLDDMPENGPSAGSSVGLFLPRETGIYHWPCVLRSLEGPSAPPGSAATPGSATALVDLSGEPVFVQRRLRERWESNLGAEVRRVRAARRSPAHLMRVLDLSRGGLKLEGPFPLSTGDTLEVTIDLGPQVHLVGRAVMAYPTSQDTWAAHVSFVDGQGHALEVVEGFITRKRRSN